MRQLKNIIQILLPLLICFLTACSSLDTEPVKRVKKQKRKKVEISQSAARDVASIKSNAFFGETGLDFLSKKLEDTISGYKGLQEKISGLEERLSKLIFLLEAKIHAVAGKDSLDDIDEDDLLIEAEEVLPYDEEKEQLSEEKSPGKKLSEEEKEEDKSLKKKAPSSNKNVVSKSSGK